MSDFDEARRQLDDLRAADPRAHTLDPARALDDWQAGRRWRAVRTLGMLALIWLPFAAIFSIVSALVGGAWNYLCPGVMALMMIGMTLTLYHRPAAYAVALISLGGLTVLYTWGFLAVFRLFPTPRAGFPVVFAAAFVATLLVIGLSQLIKSAEMKEAVEAGRK